MRIMNRKWKSRQGLSKYYLKGTNTIRTHFELITQLEFDVSLNWGTDSDFRFFVKIVQGRSRPLSHLVLHYHSGARSSFSGRALLSQWAYDHANVLSTSPKVSKLTVRYLHDNMLDVYKYAAEVRINPRTLREWYPEVRLKHNEALLKLKRMNFIGREENEQMQKNAIAG